MSKPIEPGCLAILIAGPGAGMTVSVIDRAPDLEENMMPNGVMSRGGPGSWIIETSQPLEVSYSSGRRRKVTMAVAHERKLLRIDGDEHVSTEQREEVEA